jgi:hypothetical protein
MVDTNCDPDPIDYIIPSNDDAIRAIKLMNATIATAVLEGHAIQSSLRAEEDEVETLQEDEAMERYLGPSTLAKIQEAQSSPEEDDSAGQARVEEAENADDVAAPVEVAAAVSPQEPQEDETPQELPEVEAETEPEATEDVSEEAETEEPVVEEQA